VHDPLVVAFEVRRPWPQRSRSHDAVGGASRWMLRLDSPFWILAGRGWYWPSLVTVWHREPGGHDSGEVCRQYRKWQDEAGGGWHMDVLHAWRWHVRHWKIQVHTAQDLRRRLLTRCAWCGGRSRKTDPVNISHSWDGPRGRWWQGEPGLFHDGCSSLERAHAKCLCDAPDFGEDGGGWPRDYGSCRRCGRFRPWHYQPDDADRLVASLPPGSRIPAGLRPRLDALWAERRRRRESA